MKQPFTVQVEAQTAEEAVVIGCRLGKVDGQRRGMLIADTLEAVVQAVDRKLARVQQNPGLYADQVRRLSLMKQQAQEKARAGERDRAVVELLLAHGDGRLDSPAQVGLRHVGARAWLVFGYRFDA